MAIDFMSGDPHFSSEQLVSLEMLKLRQTRSTDHAAENAAIRQILNQLTEETSTNLQSIVQAVAKVCQADSAGINQIEVNGQQKSFHWQAMTANIEDQISNAVARVREVLAVAIYRDGRVVGNLWAASHRPDRQFDMEDYRLLQSLAEMASVSIRLEQQWIQKKQVQIISRLSHDLRSPLGTIIGYSNLMKEEDLSQEEKKQFISVIDRSANKLLETIDNLFTPMTAPIAHSIGEEDGRAVSAGFHDIQAKPMDRETIVEVIKSNLECSSCSILVVEDDLDTRELVNIVASDLGAKTQCAETASEAIRILEDGFQPNLVLLDLTLPDMGGAEFVKRLRSDDRWKHLQIIVISGWDNLAERAKEMGANGSLLKPFDIDNLEKIISDSTPQYSS